MINNRFRNDIGLPEELIPLMTYGLTEYASLKKDGTPVTSPVIPFPGENGCTIDVQTGLTYPWKAERARNNPRVCLLYSEPKGSRVDNPPVVLVYGQATVHDSDLQANTTRYASESRKRTKLFRQMPLSLLRLMTPYLARIWISVTPLKILWWPGGDMQKSPRLWHAPEATHLPPSDPPPKPLPSPHQPANTPPADWRAEIDYAFDRLGIPVLTVVDEDGFPVPFRVRSGSRNSDGVHLNLLPAMPTAARGRACLTFHTIQVKDGEMYSNENMSFVGDVSGVGDSVLFKVERRLASANFKRGLKDMISLILMMRQLGKRLEIEAKRRGQPVPTVTLSE